MPPPARRYRPYASSPGPAALVRLPRRIQDLLLRLRAQVRERLLVDVHRRELADDQRRPGRTASVEGVLAGIPLIPYDLTVAREHARLLAHTRRAGRSRGAHDLQIAATAAATRRTVVTTNAQGFDGLPGIDVRLVG